MWWYVFTGSIAIIIIVYFIYCFLKSIVYETLLIIQNDEGAFLLIYNNLNKQFEPPVQKVPFDDIPTQMICTMIEKLLPGATFSYDLHFHSVDKKYDRIRDDIGPAYVYEVKRRFRKHSYLCYILYVGHYEIPEKTKKVQPYPEFYSLNEIKNMSKDICPSKKVLEIFERLLCAKEDKHVVNRKSKKQ